MNPDPTTTRAAALERLLAAELARIRRRFALHGLGRVLTALMGAIALYYLVDRGLDVHRGARLAITAGCIALAAVVLRRHLLYPLRKRLGRDDVAIAIERRFPELHERLISAVQLQEMLRRGRLRGESPVMVERVLEEAADAASRIRAHELLNTRATVRVWGAAAGLCLVLAAGAWRDPQGVEIFLRRALGADVAYPHLTVLHIQLPTSSDFKIERTSDRAVVTMAAGGDLPVIVRAEGVVPREVELVVRGGRGLPPRIAMSPRGPRQFRHVFRRVTSQFSFHARGGDDDRGDLQVEVLVVRPPRVGDIRATLTYPAYTGLEARTQFGGSVEALQGTRVEVAIRATEPVASGKLQFIDSGNEVELRVRQVQEEGDPEQYLVGSFVVTKSDRYQVELTGTNGLRNPRPGTYAVAAIEDHAPIGRLLSPTDDALGVLLPNAVLPVRLALRDDYGLAQAKVTVHVPRLEKTTEMALFEAKDGPPPRETVAMRLLRLEELPLGGGEVRVGDTIAISVRILDNRQPEPLTTVLPERQLHVVGEGDLARRISGHFRRIREEVERAERLQRTRLERLQDVLRELNDGRGLEELRSELTIVEVGQARVQSSAQRFHTQLMRAFDLHLFNGLEPSPHAATVLDLYAQRHGESQETKEFLPGFYREVGRERKAGRIGSMPKTLDPILAMTLAADRIRFEWAPRVVELVATASIENLAERVKPGLLEAEKLQKRILRELEALRNQLEEWNDYQDVISQTRALRDKQRDVRNRTMETLQGPKKGTGR